MLSGASNKYNKRAIETSKTIEELIVLVNEMVSGYKRGEEVGLIKEEIACSPSL